MDTLTDATAAVDLLADLIHYAKGAGFEWEYLLDRATRHYEAEERGEL